MNKTNKLALAFAVAASSRHSGSERIVSDSIDEAVRLAADLARNPIRTTVINNEKPNYGNPRVSERHKQCYGRNISAGYQHRRC